jgi:hypothetical protein
MGAEAGGIAGGAEGIIDAWSGFFAGAALGSLDVVLQARGAGGASTGKTGFVIGAGLRRWGRQNVVLGGNGLGRRSGMPGVDVALLGRGLVAEHRAPGTGLRAGIVGWVGVDLVLGFPNFIGCRGNLAEVVEIGEGFAGSGDRSRCGGGFRRQARGL